MIIITGGAGFIGSSFVRTLSKITASPLVVCDDFGNGDPQKTQKWQNLKRHLVHDIISPLELFDYLEAQGNQVEMIVHMGGVSDTMEKNLDAVIESNFKLSKDLFDWCALHSIRFIYASDASTYGRGEHGFKDGFDARNLEKLTPLNGHAWSRHALDRFVTSQMTKEQSSNKKVPTQCVGLKFFSVYGPNEYHKGQNSSIAYTLYDQISKNAHAKLYKSKDDAIENGEQKRDFVYIEDCCKVLKWLYETPSVSGLFNVGTGQSRTFNDMAHAVFSATKKEAKIEYISMPDGLSAKYQYTTEADLTNLRDAGFKDPFTPLEDGVKDYIQRFLQQEDPYA